MEVAGKRVRLTGTTGGINNRCPTTKLPGHFRETPHIHAGRPIKELAQAIERPPHNWTPDRLWNAYEAVQADKVRGTGQRLLTDLVSLVRHALDPEGELVPFPEVVAERYTAWIEEQAAVGRTFTGQQRVWPDRIRDHIAASLRITPEDFDYAPFNQHGGLGAAYVALGDELDAVLNELNVALVS